MFIEKSESGKNKLTNISKSIIGAFTIIGFIAGAIFFMEDRYLTTASAAEKFKIMETGNVQTFQMYQKGLEIEQRSIQKSREMQLLEDYYDHRLFLLDAVKRNPNDTLMQDRLNRINTKIKALEQKVYR